MLDWRSASCPCPVSITLLSFVISNSINLVLSVVFDFFQSSYVLCLFLITFIPVVLLDVLVFSGCSITKYKRMGSLNDLSEIYFLSCGGWESEIKSQHGWVLVKTLPWAYRWLSSPCVLMWPFLMCIWGVMSSGVFSSSFFFKVKLYFICFLIWAMWHVGS